MDAKYFNGWNVDETEPFSLRFPFPEDLVKAHKGYRVTIVNVLDNISHTFTSEELLTLIKGMPYSIYKEHSTIVGKLRAWLEDEEIKIVAREKIKHEIVPKISDWKHQVLRNPGKGTKINHDMGYTRRKDTNHRKSL